MFAEGSDWITLGQHSLTEITLSVHMMSDRTLEEAIHNLSKILPHVLDSDEQTIILYRLEELQKARARDNTLNAPRRDEIREDEARRVQVMTRGALLPPSYTKAKRPPNWG